MYKGLKENGLFITFEGTDGCGKTTTLNIIKKMLENTDIPTVYTKEPSDPDIKSKILNPNLHLSKLEQAKLFMIDRRKHLADIVLPAITAHKLVICDRYVLSNLAYQGDYVHNPYYMTPTQRKTVLPKYPKETQERAWKNHCDVPTVDKNHVLKANLALPEFIYPNLDVYMQADLRTNLQRLSKRTEKSDKYDKALEDAQKMHDLQKQYESALMDLDSPYLLVNNDYSPKERASYIFDEIMSLVKDEPTKNVHSWAMTPY